MMVEELGEAGEEAGLIINLNKTKTMIADPQKVLKVANSELENRKEVIYLGQVISLENKTEKEVNHRIALAWRKFWSLKHILKNQYSNKLKCTIITSCVLPTLTYGCQTWSLTQKIKNRIDTTQNAMERSLLNIKRRDKVKQKIIKGKLKYNLEFARRIKRLKWDWAGHVARANGKSWIWKTTNWLNLSGRKRGRQRTRWGDDIANMLQHRLYHRIAQERLEWARLREAYARYEGF